MGGPPDLEARSSDAAEADAQWPCGAGLMEML